MTSYNRKDSSIAYELDCDENTKRYFFQSHPEKVCETIGWGDYCGEPWVPR